MAILGFINDLFKREEKNSLSSLLKKGTISFLEATTRDQALEVMAHSLEKEGKLPHYGDFYEALLRREKIVSTGIGMGVAVPHAKLEIYSQFFLSIGIQKSERGIDWNSLDGTLVKLIFMIGGPASRQEDYLQILSRLTTAIKDEKLRQALYQSTTKQEVLSLF